MSAIHVSNNRRAETRHVQARYRRRERLWARLEDPETVLSLVGFAFVAGVCMAGLIGFLMPI